jgi:hypothetical protein
MRSPEALVIENLFMIPDKQGRDVPFTLNSAQQRLDRELTLRHLVPKARQEGVSSYVLALFTVRCLHKRNTRAVVISHDRESTERLFRRVKYFLENLRGPKPVLEFASKREFTFPRTNSMYYIGTAGARKFGRGDTITDLHCSEVAFWENPKELFSGLSDAVPRTGQIILESTGNGKNWYYDRCMGALEGKGRYNYTFLDWQSFHEYDLPVSEEEEKRILGNLDSRLEEDTLVGEHGLTAGQIKFRREKLEEKDGDLDLFRQEYPMTIDECFRSTGRSIFHKVNYRPLPNNWLRISSELWGIKGHPKPQFHYVLGIDASAGVGADNSVIQIICLEQCRQVGEWVSDRVEPDVLGRKAASLGRYYNGAFIVVERNNHGLVTLHVLREEYSTGHIYKERVNPINPLMNYGFYTSSTTKPLMIGNLRTALAEKEGGLVIHSPALKGELDTFIEHPNGKLEAEEGYKDDRVIALGMAVVGFRRAAIYQHIEPPKPAEIYDPFTLDAIVDEMRGRRAAFPISPQHRIEYD